MMLSWDKACIDYRHWYKLKHTYGVYFTTCEKSNSTAEICSLNLLDRSEPRNEGVVSDHLVGTSSGVQLRRVVYTNPMDGVTYTYNCGRPGHASGKGGKVSTKGDGEGAHAPGAESTQAE